MKNNWNLTQLTFQKHLDFSRKGHRGDTLLSNAFLSATRYDFWPLKYRLSSEGLPLHIFYTSALVTLSSTPPSPIYPKTTVDQQLSTFFCHNCYSDIFEKKRKKKRENVGQFSRSHFAAFEAPYFRIQLPYRFASSKKLLPPTFRSYCSQKNFAETYVVLQKC